MLPTRSFVGDPPSVRTTWLMLSVALSLLICEPAHAQQTSLISVGPRVGVGAQNSPLGDKQKEDFRQYDVAATFGLPWSWYHHSGWGLGTRLTASAGQLQGGGQTGFMGTLIPAIAVDGWGGRVSIDLGGGGALLSETKYGVQDFGGPFQFVGTTGIRFLLYQSLITGYRFQHFSDATIYGDDSRGVDMHLLELSYRF